MNNPLNQQVFDFLEVLKLNNNRPWFEANKQVFLGIQEQFKALLAEILPAAEPYFPGCGMLKPEKCMFRIYRDVRFSKNKDPYKVNLSAEIGSTGRKSGYKSVYLHIENHNSFIAAGAYELPPDHLLAIRQEIDYNAPSWHSIVDAPEFKQYFGQIQGNQLKTAPKGYEKTHPEIAALRHTQWYVVHNFSNPEVLSTRFPRLLLEGFERSLPFTKFIAEATAQTT